MLLLATLNRLQGQDDPRKRSSLISALAKQHDTSELAKLLPERIEQVKKFLDVAQSLPKPRAPKPVSDMPVAVHFFLTPDEKRRLNRRLHTISGSREEALMTLIDQQTYVSPSP